MKFSIEAEPFLRVLQELRPPASAHTRAVLRIRACAPQIYVECGGLAAGLQGAIWEEGECEVRYRPVWRLVLSQRHSTELLFQADPENLRVGTVPLPVLSYSRAPTHQARCDLYLATDCGFVPSRFAVASAEAPRGWGYSDS